ncbi:hypothetical protein BDD12DRAFT_902139 [Trichophaea hybrida]|nr:hypothetical protein BDD12DRAFT_902139 [Trichophaea hybrida]
MQTPYNCHDLREPILKAIAFPDANPTFSGSSNESSIAFLKRLAYQSKAALTLAQIAEIETADIRRCYTGIQTSRANRKKLTKELDIDGRTVIKLEKAAQMNEKAEEEKI